MELAKIKLNPNNPRFIKDEKFKKLCNSINEFPKMLELRPIIIDTDGMILGGNMRYRAIKELGLELKQEWFKEADSLTAEEKRRFIVEDNVGFGEWDWELLSSEFEKEELEAWGLDIDKNWKKDDIIEDKVPEITENPVSKIGEVYQLGRHKLMCGDSTRIEDVEKLMGGGKADMVFTDPPYNADYHSRGSDKTLREGIQNDSMSDNDFEDFIAGFLPNLTNNTKSGGAFYVCCNWKDSYPRFYFNLQKHGVNISANIVWNKGSGGMGWQDYRYQYEFIIYGFKKDGSHNWYGGRTETDIWDFNRDNRGSYDHPTQKPVALSAKAISNSSKSEDIVLDLFGGSGSTLMGAEQTNRIAYLMELDPKYCDVIRKRYAKFINLEDWESATPKIL